MQTFIGELKRRKVLQVTGVYLVAVWGFSAGAADIFDVLGFPESATRHVVLGLFLLTPLAALLAWFFELKKTGITRDTGGDTGTDQTTIFATPGGAPVLTAFWEDKRLAFAKDFVIGRDDDCEFQLIDPLVSRRHARVELKEGRWRIVDLGSANGITVNGEKVPSAWLGESTNVGFYPGGPQVVLRIGHGSTQPAEQSGDASVG